MHALVLQLLLLSGCQSHGGHTSEPAEMDPDTDTDSSAGTDPDHYFPDGSPW